MSGPMMIGPINPVVNTPQHFTFPAETLAIYVQNYTRFVLLVSFSSTPPTATDSLNNQYDGVLAAGGRDLFYVQSRGASAAERSLNAIGAFNGTVWIMPIDRTGSQANVGTVSGVNDLWVSAYGPYDPPPPITGGMPLNVDLSSQPRVISLPTPGDQIVGGDWNTASGTLNLMDLTATASNVAAGFMVLYLFHLAWLPQIVASGTVVQSRLQLQAQPTDGLFNPIGAPVSIYHGPMISSLTTSSTYTTPLVLQPHFPLVRPVSLAGGAVNVRVQFVKLGGGDLVIDYQYVLSYDRNNAVAPPGYGGNLGAQRWGGQFSSDAGLW